MARNESQKKYAQSTAGREARRRYEQSPKGAEARRRYQANRRIRLEQKAEEMVKRLTPLKSTASDLEKETKSSESKETTEAVATEVEVEAKSK